MHDGVNLCADVCQRFAVCQIDWSEPNPICLKRRSSVWITTCADDIKTSCMQMFSGVAANESGSTGHCDPRKRGHHVNTDAASESPAPVPASSTVLPR